MRKIRRKYGNQPVCVDDISFASKKEARRYCELLLLEKAEEIDELYLQPKFPFFVNEIKVFTYVADFKYRDIRRDATVIEDVKSEATRKNPVYRIKKKCVEAYYGITIEEV